MHWMQARKIRAAVRANDIPQVARFLKMQTWEIAAIITMKTVFSPFELDDFFDPDYVFEPNVRPRTLAEAVAYTGLENIARVTGLPKDLLLDLTDPIQVMSPFSIENFLCHSYVKPSIEFVRTHVHQRDTLLC